MTTLEEQYKNTNFDFLDTEDTMDNTTDFIESIETTENFLENLEVNFYEL
ncbi:MULTISPECIES: hypothetical protein [Mammaliicoccus]|nr:MULTISPECIES: hypothetical protein [Mammaliicoccus]UXU70254.1 hypothetical protein MUA36_06095 [Mammaliicoccus sciuri]WQL34376.1 hypothetical protein P3U41_06265 [Mammaliicoccus sciuri]WQL61315.1 hypothetical protein P3T96_06265 [Mammaliicoccus sciuri]